MIRRLATVWLALCVVATACASDVRARIDSARKSPLVVEVVDWNDNPVQDVEIEATQLTSDVKFGCNIFMLGHCSSKDLEQAYRERFRDVFDFATLPFYWPWYEEEQGKTRAAAIREVADWCRENDIAAKGHPLIWNWEDPRWLPDDTNEVKRLTLQRVDDCVRGFKGRIDVWDVANEFTHPNRRAMRGVKQTRMWNAVGSVELLREAFARARQANPDATLLLNDYRTGGDFAKLIESLRVQDGSFPFDVIGIQSHMHEGVWSTEQIREVCDRIARFGVPLHFTELTILSGEPGWRRPQPWPSTPEGEKRQAEEVERVYSELFAHPAVEAITWWDFSDHGAWMGAPAGLLRADMTPKPAYDVLRNLITNEWRSKVEGVTDASGRFEAPVFRGAYKLRYQCDDVASWTDSDGGTHSERVIGCVGLVVGKAGIRWGCKLESQGNAVRIKFSRPSGLPAGRDSGS